MENEENKSADFNTEKSDTDFRGERFGKIYKRHSWASGVILLLIGVAILIKRLPLTVNLLPDWLFDWPMILIIIGLAAGFKNRFRCHFGWLFLTCLGLYFLLKDQNIISEKSDNYILPFGLILFGLIFIFRRNRFEKNNVFYTRRERMFENFKRRNEFAAEYCRAFDNKNASFGSSEDIIGINAIFGKAQKSVFSKSFKGGNISCSFSGVEADLTQADMEDSAVIDLSVSFGGVEIRVPSNWGIQNDLSVLMGGVEDKRKLFNQSVPQKLLVLKGNIFCGGVEIKN